MPDAIRNPAFQKEIVADPRRVWSAPEILRHAFALNSSFQPGESWQYSNTNTILLALAAEDATGKPFGELLARKIIRPLGLKHTGFSADGKLPFPHPHGYRYGRPGHPIGYGKTRYDVSEYSSSWTHAAGDLYSAIGDLHRATRPLCIGTLLTEDSRRILHDWYETDRGGYRYGFCIESWDGYIGHRGDVPGYQAVVAVRERSGRALTIMTNLSNTSGGEGPASEMLRLLPD